MGALGGVVLLLGIGGMFVVQFLTLVTAQLLPKHWPATVRWLLAILLPPLVLGGGWLVLALI